MFWVRVLTSPDRWRITLFSQLALISQLCLHYINCYTMMWELKLFSLMFYCCVCMKKTFPSLFYIICGSASESSFAPIILFRVSLCPMNFCANRKLPSKVLSDIDTRTKNYFVCSAMHFGGKIQLHSQGCIILHILLTQPTVYEIFSGEKN